VDPLDVALGLTLGGGQLRALGALGLELLEAVLELGQALLDVLVAVGLGLLWRADRVLGSDAEPATA